MIAIVAATNAMKRFRSGIASISPVGKNVSSGVAIDHGPKERGEHEEDADHAEDNGRVREKQDLDQDEDDAENEERDDFPAGQAGQIVAEKKERKTNTRQ